LNSNPCLLSFLHDTQCPPRRLDANLHIMLNARAFLVHNL
jgi:hypothetical protein